MASKILVKTIILLVCGAAALVISIAMLTSKKTKHLSEDLSLIQTASKLVEIADSVRNSKPDSALLEFQKAILMLQKLENSKDESHLLGISYVGMMSIYAESGDNKQALKNDSVAMAIAARFGDNQVRAKALTVRGMMEFRLGNYEIALDYFQKGMDLAIEIKDFEIQAKIFTNRAMIWFYQGDKKKTIEGFTNALDIGKKIKNKMLIAGNYMNLAIVYTNMNQNDSVRSYYQLALKLFKELNDKDGQLLCYQNFGSLYYDYSDFDKAITNYELSVQLAIEMHDKTNEAKGYHNLAEVYMHIGDNAKATEFLFKSIKIKEQLNNKLSLAQGYIGLGEMYYNRNENSKARIYFDKSLKISRELKNIKQIGSNLCNLADLFCAENKPDSAMIYFNKALPYYLQIENYLGISNLYINMGAEFALNRDFPSAEKCFLKALKEKTKISDQEGYAIANHHLANLYLNKALKVSGQSKSTLYQKAEKAGLESYNRANRIGTVPVKRDASGILKRIYQSQGKYSEALKYSEIFNALSDSLLNKDKIQALTFAEARWNIEKKQQEISSLENTQKLNQKAIKQQEIETRQQRIIIWFIVVLLILITGITILASLYFRKKRTMEYQKQLSNNTILRMQNIRNALSPHFIFNVLNNIWAIMDDKENARSQFDNLIILIRRSIINTERLTIPLIEELDFVKSFIELQKLQMGNNLQVEWYIEEGINLDLQIPGMILQIPVENAIKHGLAHKKNNRLLRIHVKTESSFLKFIVSDNGFGINQAPSPTKGTGTGLKVLTNTIHILNQINKEKMSYEILNRGDEDGSGTNVIIKIPLKFNYNLN